MTYDIENVLVASSADEVQLGSLISVGSARSRRDEDGGAEVVAQDSDAVGTC